MDLANEAWFQFLDDGMKDLVQESYALLELFQKMGPDHDLHDYSFVVFPMAKAYEGFLKKWFYSSGMIDQSAFQSDHFRIGKALNPSLPPKYKDDWYVFDKIKTQCSDLGLADHLWRAWKEGRNLTFHYYSHRGYALTLPDARLRIDQLASAMAAAIACAVTRPS